MQYSPCTFVNCYGIIVGMEMIILSLVTATLFFTFAALTIQLLRYFVKMGEHQQTQLTENIRTILTDLRTPNQPDTPTNNPMLAPPDPTEPAPDWQYWQPGDIHDPTEFVIPTNGRDRITGGPPGGFPLPTPDMTGEQE